MKLIECVPNFSEGRNREVVDSIESTIRGVEGILFLGKEMDADHNRSVLTFAGPPGAVERAAFEACRRAAELIDLNSHHGEHPRIGATDVIPLIPLAGVEIEECIRISRRLAERIASELNIPTYLYELSAIRPDRKSLSDIRKGEFEGLREEIKHEARRPDYGRQELHPTAGATVVGVRPFLVAYNVYLSTPDTSVARRIASRIRERNGGMPGVKALGFYIEKRKMAQVSMNLTDLSKTTMLAAFDRVREEARKENTEVVSSEIVGLAPAVTILEAAAERLKLEEFSVHQILEEKLLESVLERGVE